MAWTFNINALVAEKKQTIASGQVQFSGSYTTGGDAGGSFVTAPGANTAGWPDFKPSSSVLHAAEAPISGTAQLDGGYIGIVVPVAGSVTPKIKVINPATNAEIAAGAYPAGLTAAVYSTMTLAYPLNL